MSVTAKREQYRKATQYSAAPNDMVKLGGIGRSDSKPQNLAVTRSHTEYSLSHFGVRTSPTCLYHFGALKLLFFYGKLNCFIIFSRYARPNSIT
jgi:hypothetical protein